MSQIFPRLMTLCLANLFGLFIVFTAQATNDNVLLDKLTVKDGLSQGSISAVMQDNSGLIWFGTANGLNIYDGYSVRQLAGPNNDFHEASVTDIKQYSQEQLWFYLAGKGLYSYDPYADRYEFMLNHDPSNKEYVVRDFFEIDQESSWIITTKTVGILHHKSKYFEPVANLSEALVGAYNLRRGKVFDDILYIASSKGTFALNTLTKKWRILPTSNPSSINTSEIQTIEADKSYNLHISQQGMLYIGTDDGVFKLDTQAMKFYIEGDKVLPEHELMIENLSTWSFYADGDLLYIGSHMGLSSLDMTNDKADFLFGFNDVFDTMTDNRVQSITKDAQGAFWLGSSGVGAYRWDPKQKHIKNYSYRRGSDNSLSNNNIQGIHQDNTHDNLLWVSTANGLNLIDLQTDSVESFLYDKNSKGLYEKSSIFSIHEDSQQRLWLETRIGLLIFDIKTKKVIDLDLTPELTAALKEPIHNTFLDENQWLWEITNQNIKRFSLSTFEIDYLPEVMDKIAKDNLWAVLGYLPNTQKMLISTNEALWSFDTVQREMALLYTYPNVLTSEWSSFESWVIDKNNIFWSTFNPKGLLGFTYPNLQKRYDINRSNSIINSNTYGLMLDEQGDIWFSTHAGIFMLNPSTQHLRHFDTSDGFLSNEFNEKAHEKLRDNRLVYGGMNGVSIFDPLALKKNDNSSTNRVHITHVNVLSRDLKTALAFNDNDLIKLNYDDVGIRVDFSTLLYGNHNNNQFEFTLTGDSHVEYPSTYKNNIVFPSLPAGYHTLEIRAKDTENGGYLTPTRIRFYVSHAPWTSPFAYTIYLLTFVYLVSLFFARRRAIYSRLFEAHQEVKFRENRLQLALQGSNSEVWDWQAHNDLMFGKRISEELGYIDFSLSYKFTKHIELIHPDDRDKFLSSWQRFIHHASLAENFVCSYRLQSLSGDWLWYKDLGKIVEVGDEGKPIRITGSYTNITKTRADEEQAQYYGEAFKQTKDWMLIVDEKLQQVTANQALRNVFGWREDNVLLNAKTLGILPKRISYYLNLLSTLKENEHWRGEDLFKTKDGNEYHVIINITVSKNVNTGNLHFICVFTDISAQKTAEKELRILANYDHLTGLPNRSLLLDRIEHGIVQSLRSAKPMALFFIDLDRFKQVNDSLGHDYGDLLLKQITRRLTLVLRADDTVARIGGDEFVVLLESYRNGSYLGKIAQKIIDEVGRPFELNEDMVSVGASIGIAVYPQDSKNSTELLRHADVAMYHAKQAGRNNFQFFTPEMNIEALDRLQTETKLKSAHANKDFINHYQPVVDSITGKAVGVELLMRWQDGDRLIPPDDFIPLSEELGLIIPMTEDALERGISDLKQWREIRQNMFLSVNLAPQHFAKESLVPYISSLLKEKNLPANALKIEVTESALLSEPEKSIKTMRELSQLGVILALDDFGTGFSSLSYLKQLPLDIIKIDRSFVSGIGVEKTDEAIVDATLVLAKRLNMSCIAEGVETKEQLNYLSSNHCNLIQGYFYSKPVDNRQITAYLQESSIEIQAD